jgi:hypothetical protein
VNGASRFEATVAIDPAPCHIPSMAEASYSILPEPSGTYAVLVRESSDASPITKGGFATETAAKAWIAEQQRMARVADEWERHAPRNWRD